MVTFHPGYGGGYDGRGRKVQRCSGRHFGGRSRGGRDGRGGHGGQADAQAGQIAPVGSAPRVQVDPAAPAQAAALLQQVFAGQFAAGNGTQATNEQAAQAAALLQQTFAIMQGGAAWAGAGQVAGVVASNARATSKLEMTDNMSKATASTDKPESSAQGAARGGKPPYCYRCHIKGHSMKECDAELYCEVCDSHDHAMERCPIYAHACLRIRRCRPLLFHVVMP